MRNHGAPSTKRGTRGTPKKGDSEELGKAQMIAALAGGSTVLLAAMEAGVGRTTAYRWRNADEAFAQAWDEAVDEGTDRLEQEAIRRGRDGVSKPVFQNGKRVGYVQEYSDTLLIFMLKARRPDVYRERANIEHTGPGGKDLPAATVAAPPTGVLVVPGLIQDPNAWAEMVRNSNSAPAGASNG